MGRPLKCDSNQNINADFVGVKCHQENDTEKWQNHNLVMGDTSDANIQT